MLTHEQQQLVVDHLDLVGYVLKKYIKINPQRWEYAFEELYQVGYEGLCIAAASYDPYRNCTYWHYGEIVMRNHLYSYCRKLNRLESVYLEDVAEPSYSSDDAMETLIEQITLSNLDLGKYKGVTQKGIEAMKLKNLGYSGKEIAEYYQVPVNHISAWIARAKNVLQKELQIS